MRAIVHIGAPGLDGIRVAEPEVPSPGADEVLISVDHAGLNRHELFLADRRRGDEPAQILGADAVGSIVAAGPEAGPHKVGDRVLVDPTLGWPHRADVPLHPDILGDRAHGTFAEHVVVPAVNAHPVPVHLSSAEAGALGLAAVTAYRALTSIGEVEPGEHVLIPGIGSGVGLLALDIAQALGAHVTVTSRSDAHLASALERGAADAVRSDQVERLRDVDLVIDTVGSATVPQALGALRPGGRLVTLGATSGTEVQLSLRDLFFKQLSVRGTSVGSSEEFRAMLELVTRHAIRPLIAGVHPLATAPAVMRASATRSVAGKSVFQIRPGGSS